MTISASVAHALRGPVALLEREFGLRVSLRRPEYTESADGATSLELVRVPGVSETALRVIVTETNVEALAKEWGRETGATVGGLASDATPWRLLDVVRVREGGTVGRWLEVVALRPTEAGGIVQMALREASTDLSVLDKGF